MCVQSVANAKERLTVKHFSNRLWPVFVVLTLLFVSETRLGAQSQGPGQTPAQVRSHAEEMAEWWNQIGKKLIAMAKDFPEDKYDFKVQKDERTFAENLLHIAAVDFDVAGKVAGTHIGPDFGKDAHSPQRAAYPTKAVVVKLLEDAVAAGAKVI